MKRFFPWLLAAVIAGYAMGSIHTVKREPSVRPSIPDRTYLQCEMMKLI